jgi:hypothetical protein
MIQLLIIKNSKIKWYINLLLILNLFLNKNCQFKLDNSIISSSITVTMESFAVDTPIIDKFFNTSQPITQVPIKNIFNF